MPLPVGMLTWLLAVAGAKGRSTRTSDTSVLKLLPRPMPVAEH